MPAPRPIVSAAARAVVSSIVCLSAVSVVAAAQNPPVAPPATQTQPAEGAQPAAQPRRAPRPYAQVITARAHTEKGGITVHHVDDRYFFEIPDSLMGRDFLMVTRVSGAPSGGSGFQTAGSSLNERMVRWERVNDRVILKSISVDAVADDSLPIARSVAQNNFAPIIGAFPIAAFTRDSTSYVVDVTDYFATDNPSTSGLNADQRRAYGVRRFDPARSYISGMRGFPINIEVRQVQTFDAATPPGDRNSGTVTMETRQSLLLLPKVPMRARNFDARVGFFSVERVNYGLDQEKAATQTFITRWRLEPKDPAAYARGELVEPVKPIVYYLDPATPTRWKPYVKQGVESWQMVFEKAGFKNAIIAKDAPTKAEDPDFDPDDARYSMVRWAASLVRNAVGPHTSDPRSGEIVNSEITWFHNHMRSYRNWLIMETGAANPMARSLDIPDELMGETMRQVIAHEIGHALGLQHNMIASSSFPTDSLRSPTFTSKYGVSATIMDYARQNYIAQPGDGLTTKDFIRRLGPFDDFAINWGYRVLPANSTDAEKPALNNLITNQTGPMPYRFTPQTLGAADPRVQTEDLGDDPVKSSMYATMNYKKMIPNLVAWTTKPGDDYADLQEVYEEAIGRWFGYMGHVAMVISGVNVDLKTADQAGAVYHIVPKAKQKAALAFLSENVFTTPMWLQPQEIITRVGPSATMATRQAAIVSSLLTSARLSRLAASEKFDAVNAYPLAEYLSDLRKAMWTGANPDANRRQLQRVYLQRLEVLINPPATPPQQGGAQRATPFVTPPNVTQSDLPALARAQLRDIQRDARASLAVATATVERAHWSDIIDRVTQILEPKKVVIPNQATRYDTPQVMTGEASNTERPNSIVKIIFASAAGTMIEWYDFYLFALIGTVVAPQFYQSSTELGAVISWLATFAVGFIVRPFGAIVFGRVGDLVGRKYTFLVTMIIMGFCTFAIGLLPTRAKIGDFAGVLLISLRILQGLALGGEYGGAATYIAEHAPQGKRGAYTSWIQTTATLGLLVGLVVVLVTRQTLGEADFAAYGWRIPFLASAVLVGVSLYIRLSLNESPLFAKLRDTKSLSVNPIKESFGNWFNLRYVLLALFGATMGQGVVWYTGQFYALFYLTSIFKVPLVPAYTVMGAAVLLATPFFVIFGTQSDKIGRKRIMLTGMLLAVLTYIPIYSAIGNAVGPITPAVTDAAGRVVTAAVASSPNVPLLIALVFIQVVYVTLVYAPIAAFLVELFPTKIRYTSMSLPYHIGNGIFGGLVPVIGLILIQAATDAKAESWLTPIVKPMGHYAGLLYPTVIATVCFVVGLLLLPETKDVDVMAGESTAGSA